MPISFLNRKKPLQASGMTSAYANNPVTATYYRSNPVASYGQSVISGNGIQPLQQAVSTPKVTPKPVTTSQPYQASGMDSRYASNPSNYITPKPVTTDSVTSTSPWSNPFLERMRQSSETRAGLELGRAEEKARALRESYDRQAARTRSLAPMYQQNFDTYKKAIEEGVSADEAQAARDLALNDEVYGEALRQGAQANRESLGQIQNLFAGLGTLDSSAFQNQTLNQQTKFAGNQQSILREKAGKAAEINATLSKSRRDAQLLIQQEQFNLQEKLVNIENTLDQGSVEYETAIREAYNTAYDNVSKIDSDLAGVELSAYQEWQKLNSDSNNPVGEAQVAQLADFDNSIQQVGNLTNLVNQYANILGPVQGRVRSINPYDTDAQIFNSQMKAVAQMVGRAMEGGVLRQEDVPKYEAILPKITDTKEVALGKIQNVIGMLQNQRNQRAGSFQAAGYSGTPQVSYVTSTSQRPDLMTLMQQYGG